MHRNRRHDSAFTLIELLVVITIIAILAGLTFPVLSRARESAYQARCTSNLRQVGLALLQYKTELGDFPPPSVTFNVGGQIQYWGGIASLMKAGFLDNPDAVRCPDDLLAANKPKSNTPEEEYRYYSSYQDYYNYWGYQSAKVHNAAGGVTDKQFPGSTPASIIGNLDPGVPCTAPGAPGDLSVWTTADVRAFYLHISGGVADVGCAGIIKAIPEVSHDNFPLWDCANNEVSAASPMLRNPNPPPNTIVAHCPHHRFHYGRSGGVDLAVRIDASVFRIVGIPEYDWVNQSFDAQ